MDLTTQLFNEKGIKNDSSKPLYHGTRKIWGLYDLVVSFKTNKCHFSCNFCSLPQMSGENNVSQEQLVEQIDNLFNLYSDKLDKLERLTVRNEGSVLDNKRFFPDALNYLIAELDKLPKLQLLSLETRLEYVTEARLKEIIGMLGANRKLDLTTGFETQDEYILNEILGKKLKKRLFEQKVKLLGEHGIEFTAYVMLKPAPEMTEQDGISEALKSIDYLHILSKKTNTKLTIYLNPMYIAEGSKLAAKMKKARYKQPTQESLNFVIAEAKRKDINVYTD